jgi:hypothetical protein
MIKIGTTLTQTALAARLDRSTTWVRDQGELVTGYALDSKNKRRAHEETWARMEFSNRRCAGYKLMVSDER